MYDENFFISDKVRQKIKNAEDAYKNLMINSECGMGYEVWYQVGVSWDEWNSFPDDIKYAVLISDMQAARMNGLDAKADYFLREALKYRPPVEDGHLKINVHRV